MRVAGQRHAPAALHPGVTRYPLYRRMVRPQGRSGRVLKTSHSPGFDPRTVQLVASRYTNYAIRAHCSQWVLGLFLRGKPAWARNSHLSPFNIGVKIKWSYSSTPPIRLHVVDRDKFTFLQLPSTPTLRIFCSLSTQHK